MACLIRSVLLYVFIYTRSFFHFHFTTLFRFSQSGCISAHLQKGHDNVGIRQPYLRVIGVKIDTEKSGKSASTSLSPADEEELRRLASTPGIYDRIARSIAPSIFGSIDIKKAIAVMLFGGSRKKLPDGLTRRGDINMLLLGDPGNGVTLDNASTNSF